MNWNGSSGAGRTWETALKAGQVRVQLCKLQWSDLACVCTNAFTVEEVCELLTASGCAGCGDSFEDELYEVAPALHTRNLVGQVQACYRR